MCEGASVLFSNLSLLFFTFGNGCEVTAVNVARFLTLLPCCLARKSGSPRVHRRGGMIFHKGWGVRGRPRVWVWERAARGLFSECRVKVVLEELHALLGSQSGWHDNALLLGCDVLARARGRGRFFFVRAVCCVGAAKHVKDLGVEPRFQIARVCECPVPVKFYKFASNALRLP